MATVGVIVGMWSNHDAAGAGMGNVSGGEPGKKLVTPACFRMHRRRSDNQRSVAKPPAAECFSPSVHRTAFGNGLA